MAKHSLTTSNLPTHSIAKDILDIMEDDDMYLPGDLLTPSEDWQTGPQLTCVRMEVLPSPDYHGRLYHPDWKDSDAWNTKVCLTLHVEEMDQTLTRKVGLLILISTSII